MFYAKILLAVPVPVPASLVIAICGPVPVPVPVPASLVIAIGPAIASCDRRYRCLLTTADDLL
jgi:hypothetical protein